ncbi:MAG: hypothetical protein K0R38_6502 [Polyangiaceae bacterium]|nr:hypothetical protein [Polyangiaceae bacterium]
MSPLLAPIFAQLVGLQLGARTEGRYVDLRGTQLYEASAQPSVGLNVVERRTQFRVAYRPALVLSPIDSSPRRLYAFHQFATTLSYVLPRTTLTLDSAFGIGSLNLRSVGVQGLRPAAADGALNGGAPINAPPTGGVPTSGVPIGGMPTTGGAPTGGTPTTPGGPLTEEPLNQRVRFYTSTTTLNLSQRLTKEAVVSVIAGSTTTSGRDDASRRFYPQLHAWSLGGSASHTYTLSRRDRFIGAASVIKTWSSSDNEAAVLNSTLTWGHRFSPRTVGALGAGFNVTRFTLSTGLAGLSVFPTFNVGVTHDVPVGRGGLAFSVAAYSSPALDPLRALVDPRLGTTASISYTRKKLFITTTGTTAFSVAPAGNNSGALNFAQAEARTGYQLGDLTAVDAGARLIRQTYGGRDVIPTSWAAFVGLTVGYEAILAGSR